MSKKVKSDRRSRAVPPPEPLPAPSLTDAFKNWTNEDDGNDFEEDEVTLNCYFLYMF